MLRWTITFLVIAFIAAIFGFTEIAGAAAWIAKTIFFMFVVLAVIGLLTALIQRPRTR
jgi:uncharacterized membrane protein YtjA (UPF0391 family)